MAFRRDAAKCNLTAASPPWEVLINENYVHFQAVNGAQRLVQGLNLTTN